MDFDLSFVASPYSTLLGMLSFLGFLVVARKKLAVWIRGRVGAIQAASSDPTCSRATQITGLVLMGLCLSDLLFIIYHKVQMMTLGDLFLYFALYFLFVMLPGSLAGALASLWIDPTGASRQGSLLGRIFFGMIYYLALLTLIEFTDYDLLLFAFGPTAMLLIYTFSPVENAQ